MSDESGAHLANGSDGVAIRLEDVEVRYRVVVQGSHSLFQRLTSRRSHRRYREIHALKGVSLTVHHGEAVGVVGSNGAGKSTLLQVVAGLLPVVSGSVVASSYPVMLGVGAVLNRNLSGRRNIEIGCLALGMSAAETAAKFGEIVDFAEIHDHLDLPMSAYSSGMRSRLHFAIASILDPEILLIDEALAVGDEYFRDKSLNRVRELIERSGTILLVTHNLREIESTCSRAVWIDGGVVRADGEPSEIVAHYVEDVRRRQAERPTALEGKTSAADAANRTVRSLEVGAADETRSLDGDTTDGESAPEPLASLPAIDHEKLPRPDVFVASLGGRAGSRLARILSSAPGTALFDEPRLLASNYRPQLVDALRRHGLTVDRSLDWSTARRQRESSMALVDMLAEQLPRLDRWGVKEVRPEEIERSEQLLDPVRYVILVDDLPSMISELSETIARTNDPRYDLDWLETYLLASSRSLIDLHRNLDADRCRVVRAHDLDDSNTVLDLAEWLVWPLGPAVASEAAASRRAPLGGTVLLDGTSDVTASAADVIEEFRSEFKLTPTV